MLEGGKWMDWRTSEERGWDGEQREWDGVGQS